MQFMMKAKYTTMTCSFYLGDWTTACSFYLGDCTEAATECRTRLHLGCGPGVLIHQQENFLQVPLYSPSVLRIGLFPGISLRSVSTVYSALHNYWHP